MVTQAVTVSSANFRTLSEIEEAGYNNLIKHLTTGILVACDFINGRERWQSFVVDFNEIVDSRPRRAPNLRRKPSDTSLQLIKGDLRDLILKPGRILSISPPSRK